jgi:hypothetical protein
MQGNPAWPFVVKVVLNKKLVMPNLFRHPTSLVTDITVTCMVGC